MVRFGDTIDSASTIALLHELERANLLAISIYVIYDNARNNRSKAVTEYLKTSRMKLESAVLYPEFEPH